MPTAIAFTADAGTDVLTAAAHGLLTGDRFRTRNVGGALPAPLAAVTTYFAIRLDANTLKVATTSANALAGTAVNITTAGTGTHTLEYGLPYCEPRVATAGTQIYSADDNAAWDSLKAVHALVTGQTETVWNGAVTLAGLLTANAGVTCAANQHVTVSGTGKFKHGDKERVFSAAMWQGTGTRATGPVRITSTGAATFQMALPMDVGEQVKEVIFRVSGDGAADITQYDVLKTTAAGVDSSLGTGSVNNPGATWQDIVVGVTDTVIASGEALTLVVTVNAANLALGNVSLNRDQP